MPRSLAPTTSRSCLATHRRALAAVTCAVLLLGLAACGSDRDFDAAVRANTVVAFDDYLRQHPDGAHAAEARSYRSTLLEASEWDRARSAGTLESYQQYLRSYPEGPHAREGLSAIADLNLASLPSTEAGSPGAVTPRGATRPAPEADVAHPAVQGAIARSTTPIESPLAAGGGAKGATGPKPAAGPPAVKPAAAKPVRTDGAAKPAAPLRTASGAAPGVSIQLGAFATAAGANAAWKKLAARYAELGARTPVVAAGKAADGREIHRLKVSGFSRESAAAMCASLAASHAPCLVVPGPG